VSRTHASGLALAVVGATGAVGREVLDVLGDRNFPVRELRVYASAGSVGEEVEFQGEHFPIEGEPESLRGLDLVLLCTPSAVSLELVREALRAQVSCIDCSGALSGAAEVPLLAAGVSAPGSIVGAPLVATPGGPALAWSRVLSALEEAAGLSRVVGTLLQSAACAGRPGIEALSQETIALLNQRAPEPPGVFSRSVAFDCVPEAALDPQGRDADGLTGSERRLRDELRRLIRPDLALSITSILVPTFVGEGSSLVCETRRPISPEEASELLAKSPGIEVWDGEELAPSTRDSTGRDEVLVGCVRRDPACEQGLQLWAVADPLRLAATNVVQLAETRLQLN
jgi:aspartate-semialdehyde dehydrogenase